MQSVLTVLLWSPVIVLAAPLGLLMSVLFATAMFISLINTVVDVILNEDGG